MRINNNIMAMNTHRQYSINNTNISKSIEKLSSGYRINRAGDDAAGLAISEKMRAQIRGLQMASKNSQDAISLVQTAEGALQESHNILQRMREIAVQSASDTNETTIDRGALEQEFQQLIKELDDTANKTRFNDQNVIDGTFQKTATQLASAAGFATAANVHYTKNTAAGTYTHSVNYTTSTEAITPGTAPDVSSTIGGSAMFAAFQLEFGALGADYKGGGTVTGAKLTGIEQGEGANANQFKLTFEVQTDKGADTITFLLENPGDATALVADEASGLGAKLTLTANANVTNNDELMAELQAMKAKGTVSMAADGVASFVDDSTISAVYQDATFDPTKTTLYNGTYQIAAEAVGNTGLKLTITDAMTGKVVQAQEIDLATIAGAAGTDGTKVSIDLGQFGIIDLTANQDAAIIGDAAKALNGKSITISGGTAPTITGNPAAASVNAGGETIQLKEGMKSYTDSNGITINFNKTLTKADFASSDKLMQAIYGGIETSATITVGTKQGKDMVIQTGANEGDDLAINIDRMDAWNLGVDLSSVSDRESASKAITQVNDAINAVSTQRAALGALQNRLEHKIANLDTSAENLQAAESRIRDLDMAKEMTNFTKNNILAQAATAMLAQANALPQGVLQLLG